MHKMTRRKATALVLAALLLLAAAPAQPLLPTARAVTQSDIDGLKEDKKGLNKEKKEIEDQLAQLRNDKATAIQRRTLLDQKIDLTVKEIAATESEIAGYEALLDQTAFELAENEQEEARQYALFCERARVMEEAGTASYWAVLFKAENFSDLLSRLSDVQEVMDYDQSVLDGLRQLRAQIESKQEEQEDLKTQSEEAKAQLEVQKADLEQQHAEAEALYKEIQANVAEYEAELAEMNAERDRIQAEIVEKSNELARQMAMTTTKGGYIWPETVSRRITSPQGARDTGIKGASTNHKGVDIGGVGTTTSVLATKAGVVITSALHRSYGNYVVIMHGEGNTTLYAHMSSRSVKEGDTVTQGQVIGITGSTGVSSGPHLHYEITEGGVRVNPLDYLPGWIKAW